MENRSRSRANTHGERANDDNDHLHNRRVRGDSAEREIARHLNIPTGGTMPHGSAAHPIPHVTSRDYAEPAMSTTSTQPRSRYNDFSFGPSFRRRIGSAAPSMHISPGPSHSWRGFYEPSRASVAIAPGSNHNDAASRKFSFAGPPTIESVLANQPYVDPGYAQLNPAYDQPSNVRPVWSLARPLPRVLRPGMVPSTDELEKELEDERHDQEHDQSGVFGEIESGRIEPSLRLDKVASQLDTIRRDREISLFRSYRHLNQQETPQMSPFGVGRRNSDTPTETGDRRSRFDDVIREEAEERDSRDEEPPELELPQLSRAVSNVRRAKEAESIKLPYEDAVPLPAYEAEDDEIHNLHTYWSVIRLRCREPFAEFLAVLTLDTLGFCINCSLYTSRGASGTGDTANYAWGLAVMLAIYVAGGISGAQLNPAMTFMLYIFRGFPLRKIPIFAVAQFMGAFTATMIAYTIFKPGFVALQQEDYSTLMQTQGLSLPISTNVIPTAGVLANFITFPRQPWISFTTAFLSEYVGSVLLVVAVLALGDDTNSPPGAGMSAFIVGLLVVCLGMALGGNTGLALNPIRDFGPRCALTVLGLGQEKSLFADGYWFRVAWLAPFTGIMTGGLLYDLLIFTGGESPVNYPPKRIKRAARKWKKRMKARFRRTKRKVQDIKDDAVSRSEWESFRD